MLTGSSSDRRLITDLIGFRLRSQRSVSLRGYLRELEDETDWSPDGRGFKLANAGGRGPVAQIPRDPGKLDVIIDSEFLWPQPKGA